MIHVLFIYLLSVAVCVYTSITEESKRERKIKEEFKDSLLINDFSFSFFEAIRKSEQALKKDIFVSLIPFVNTGVAILVCFSKLFKK